MTSNFPHVLHNVYSSTHYSYQFMQTPPPAVHQRSTKCRKPATLTSICSVRPSLCIDPCTIAYILYSTLASLTACNFHPLTYRRLVWNSHASTVHSTISPYCTGTAAYDKSHRNIHISILRNRTSAAYDAFLHQPSSCLTSSTYCTEPYRHPRQTTSSAPYITVQYHIPAHQHSKQS